MNIYVDISQMKHRLITALGKDSKGNVIPDKLEPFLADYMDCTDDMYTELYEKFGLLEEDVKDFASGEMTSTAKKLCKYHTYYTFFEDNYGNAQVATTKSTTDAMYKAYLDFKMKFDDIMESITKFDLTNDPEDITTDYILDAPRAGFL